MRTNHDERIVATHQRWAARGFGILFIALAIDLIVRTLILKQDLWQYLDIGLIWMATILYVSIGMTNTVVLTLIVLGRIHTRAEVIATVAFGLIGGGAGVFWALGILRGICARWERRTLGRVPREE